MKLEQQGEQEQHLVATHPSMVSMRTPRMRSLPSSFMVCSFPNSPRGGGRTNVPSANCMARSSHNW